MDACRHALVADKGLDAALWNKCITAIVKDVAGGVIPKKVAVKMLEEVAIMAAIVGSAEIIGAIASSSKAAQVGGDLAASDNHVLRVAAQEGHVEVVELLLAKKEEDTELYGDIDPAAKDNAAIQIASQNGRIEVVKLLLMKKENGPESYGGIKPAAGDNYAIRWASANGYVKMVEYLLEKKEGDVDNEHGYQKIDSAAENNKAIRWASENGHAEVVRLLLERKEKRPELCAKLDPAAETNGPLLSLAAIL